MDALVVLDHPDLLWQVLQHIELHEIGRLRATCQAVSKAAICHHVAHVRLSIGAAKRALLFLEQALPSTASAMSHLTLDLVGDATNGEEIEVKEKDGDDQSRRVQRFLRSCRTALRALPHPIQIDAMQLRMDPENVNSTDVIDILSRLAPKRLLISYKLADDGSRNGVFNEESHAIHDFCTQQDISVRYEDIQLDIRFCKEHPQLLKRLDPFKGTLLISDWNDDIKQLCHTGGELLASSHGGASFAIDMQLHDLQSLSYPIMQQAQSLRLSFAPDLVEAATMPDLVWSTLQCLKLGAALKEQTIEIKYMTMDDAFGSVNALVTCVIRPTLSNEGECPHSVVWTHERQGTIETAQADAQKMDHCMQALAGVIDMAQQQRLFGRASITLCIL